MCRYAFEPEVGVVGGSGDDVAVVVSCECGAVVPDESCCYFFGGDVGFLCEGDGCAVGFDEGCGGGFEGECACGHGGGVDGLSRECGNARLSRSALILPSAFFYLPRKSGSLIRRGWSPRISKSSSNGRYA